MDVPSFSFSEAHFTFFSVLGVPSDITKKTMQMVVSKIVKKATVEIIKSVRFTLNTDLRI